MINFTEFLAERLQRTKLFEMAEARADAEKQIRALGRQVYYHLIKVLYYRDDLNYNKHLNDIDIWLLDLMEIYLKPNNKRVKAIDYYAWLYESPFGGTPLILEGLINNRLREYHTLPLSGINIDEVFQKFNELYLRVAEDLSRHEFNTIKDYI